MEGSMRKLPYGEETLPIFKRNGKLLKPKEMNKKILKEAKLSLDMTPKDLLIERFRMRVEQGRTSTIHTMNRDYTPTQQLEHMTRGDAIGKEFLQAEEGLLREELDILEGGLS
jgi:hypothetical protein